MPRKALTQDLAGSGIRFLRINADQSTTELTAAQMLAALQVTPYAHGVLSATAGIDYANGPVQTATMPAANVTACPIANGAAGAELELWLTGQASDRAFTGLSGGGIPSDSLLTWPKTIVATKVYILKFKHIAGTWKLVSLVGGF